MVSLSKYWARNFLEEFSLSLFYRKISHLYSCIVLEQGVENYSYNSHNRCLLVIYKGYEIRADQRRDKLLNTHSFPRYPSRWRYDILHSCLGYSILNYWLLNPLVSTYVNWSCKKIRCINQSVFNFFLMKCPPILMVFIPSCGTYCRIVVTIESYWSIPLYLQFFLGNLQPKLGMWINY